MLKKIFLLIFLTILLKSMTAHAAVGATKKVSSEIRPHPHSWSAKVSLATKKVILEVDQCTFTFKGDSADTGQIRVSISESERQLTYRYWPDISKWHLSKEEKSLYSREFKDVPGWQKRLIHLRVDVYQTSRQVWLDDRLIREWHVSKENEPRIVLNGLLEQDVLLLSGQTKRILEEPLEHYFNSNKERPFTPDSAIKLYGDAQLLCV